MQFVIYLHFGNIICIFSVRALPYFKSVWAICMVAWLVFSILSNSNYFIRPNIYTFSIYVYVIYTVSFAYLEGNGVIGNRFFELAQLPIFFLAYSINSMNGRRKDNRILILMVIPFVLLSICFTLNAYKLYPLISRDVKAGTELGIEYMKKGIGGYEFIYFLVLIFPSLFYTIFNRPSLLLPKYRLIAFFFAVIVVINIVLSNFSTALLLLLISILYCIVVPRINSKLVPLFLFLCCILIFFSGQLLANLMDWLGTIYGNTTNAERTKEINAFLLKGQMGDALTARTFTYNNSWQAFINNPILGIITKPLGYSGKYLVGFGQHSQLLDTFALYGFGIGILQLYVYFQPIISRAKNSDGSICTLTLLMLVLFFVLLFINNATPSIGFAIFFVFPTIYDWIQERRLEVLNYDYVG